jgi:hypothetical protein
MTLDSSKGRTAFSAQIRKMWLLLLVWPVFRLHSGSDQFFFCLQPILQFVALLFASGQIQLMRSYRNKVFYRFVPSWTYRWVFTGSLTARADTVGSQIHILVRRCLALIPYHERGSCTIECARGVPVLLLTPRMRHRWLVVCRILIRLETR